MNKQGITYRDINNRRYAIISTILYEREKAYEKLGSYQGEWILITDKNIYVGYYGSCSGCDTIDAIYDYDSEKDKVLATEEHLQRILECIDKTIPITEEMHSMTRPELRIHLAKILGNTYHEDDIVESIAFYFYKAYNFSA